MEEKLVNLLLEKFPFLAGRVRVQRTRRIFLRVDAERFEEIFVYALHSLQFTILCTITGLDNGGSFGFIYHMAREDGIMLNIETEAPKTAAVIKTVTHYFPCAEIYEREIADLFGVTIEGLLEGTRYPLPDNWPKDEYPLRKDWKAANKKSENNDA